MNCVVLVELFLDQCQDGIFIREDDEVITSIENVDYVFKEGSLIINSSDTDNKYIIDNIESCEVIEYDDMIEIHREDKTIYIEMM